MPVTRQNVADVITYHPPTAAQLAAIGNVRQKAREFCEAILDYCPQCADQTAALRHVREALMTANAAIVLDGEV